MTEYEKYILAMKSALTRQAFLRGTALAALAPFLPVISRAQAAAIGVTEVAPGIFVHQGQYAEVNPGNRGDIANMSFIAGKACVAVIDTGNSAHIGASVLEAITAVTALPVRYVINTHMHPDHVLGNAAFADLKPEFVAHHKMARGLAARAEGYLSRNKGWMGEDNFEGTRIIMPTKAVTDVLDLDLGGRTLHLQARPTAHTDNDMTIYDPLTGTLLLGDLAFAGRIPTIDGSIAGWLRLIEVLKSEPSERVIPGHGPPSMRMSEALLPLERYLNAVATDVRAAIKAGRTLADTTETAAQSEKDSWLLFSENHKRNVTAAFAELEWE
jgi:quinoprotein relay system zinc metallohydrolase 2